MYFFGVIKFTIEYLKEDVNVSEIYGEVSPLML